MISSGLRDNGAGIPPPMARTTVREYFVPVDVWIVKQLSGRSWVPILSKWMAETSVCCTTLSRLYLLTQS
jgi:hypothetical protein